MAHSERGIYNDRLHKVFTNHALSIINVDLTALHPMFEMLRMPLSYEEKLDCMMWIARRLRAVYAMVDTHPNDVLARYNVWHVITNVLHLLNIQWPEEPVVICNETNNPDFNDLRVTIHFRVLMTSDLNRIDLSLTSLNVNVFSPYASCGLGSNRMEIYKCPTRSGSSEGEPTPNGSS
jgi:hypothetical protein